MQQGLLYYLNIPYLNKKHSKNYPNGNNSIGKNLNMIVSVISTAFLLVSIFASE